MAEQAIPLHEVPAEDQDALRAGRRALRAAFLGFFVDMFDVFLPVIALGPAMAYFQPATLSPALAATFYYAVFALSLIGRPVGAAFFGHYADRIGRRKVTIVSVGGFAVVTLLIGLLPGYAAWGLGSLGVLILLRFVDGLFLGGEYTGANPLAMEYAPKDRRGLWSAFIHMSFPLAMALMSVMTLVLLRALPAGSAHSAYARWGWRIPFFVGALLAVGVLLYYVHRVEESTVWQQSQPAGSPMLHLLQGSNLRCLGQVFFMMSGLWFTLNAVTAILPGVLLTVRHVDSVTVTLAQLAAYLVLTIIYIPVGMLGQKFGRRSILALIGLAGCTAGPAFYFLLVRSGYRSAAELTLLVVLINLCATPAWAIVTAYINERFPTSVRATGYGIGYSAAMIVPAFSSFYMLGLRALGLPYAYTEIVLFALGGLLLLVGALSGPETCEVELG